MERHIFNENQPQGSKSLLNLRNALRGLFQGDFMPLRPRASMILDDMEYSSDAKAQASWSGTGVTVTSSTTKQEGNYAVQMVIDATGNRKATQTKSLNLSAFKRIKIWERCSAVSSAIKFYLRDNAANESYWNITTNAVINTWQQDDLDLTVPSSNNGANANLANITEFGFTTLGTNNTYIIDTIKVICGLNVAIESGLIASFYQQVYVGQSRISFAGGSSSTITPPTTNPRIDLLVMNSSGTLSWVTGTEATSPAEPTFPTDKIPVCLIYCKTTMAKVVDYEDKDANPNEAYILKDVRPLLNLALNSFLQLTDTPSSYAGQTLKLARVNAGETAIEFATDDNVKLAGAQTVADVKTFSSIPVLPASDPTADNQASRKAYIDTSININAKMEKTSLVDDDIFLIEDSAASYIKKKVKKSNVSSIRSQQFISSGTWIRPTGVTLVFVTMVGGGGGGGSNTGQGGAGGASFFRVPVVVSGNVTVTIGAAGTGGAGGSPNAGTAGGTTSFGSLSVAGGAGGLAQTASVNNGPTDPSVVLVNTSTNANQGKVGYPGAAGGGGGNSSGVGGGSYFGVGGAANGGPGSAGNVGTGYGTGGSGGGDTQAAGANGTAGFVFVEW